MIRGLSSLTKRRQFSQGIFYRALLTSSELIRHYPKTEVTKLSNGLTVASERAVEGSDQTATISVWIDTGSRYEEEKNNGVAHFLEHMFFKGTKRRSRQDLESEIENIGGHLNAYTSREMTSFQCQVFKKDLPQGMDILSDILLNSEHKQSSIDREKGVILREAKEIENQFEESIFDHLHYTAYRGTPLARNILGTQDTILNMTREQIMDWVGTHYVAPRMVITGAGAIDHKQLVDLAQKYFGSTPSAPSTGKKPTTIHSKFTGSDIHIRDDGINMAYIALAFPTCSARDPDSIPLLVLQMMLGSYDEKLAPMAHNSSSPIVAPFAAHGYAANFQTFNTQYSDTGLFGFYICTWGTRIKLALDLITNELTRQSYETNLNLL